MTKLLEWITGGGLFVAVWAILLSKNSSDESDDCVRHFVLFLPIYAALAFAVVSVSIIAWRVYTFNTCDEAAKELQQEIKDARADLKRKGLKAE